MFGIINRSVLVAASVAMGTGLFITERSMAAALTVSQLGENGWVSRDTRDAAGNNLIAPADNAAIADVIKFGTAPSGGPTYAVNLITPTSNSAKASIGVFDGSGFANGDALLPGFSAEYQWYTEGPPYTTRISPLKIGIQTASYAGLPAGATRTGDNDWNMLLVQLPVSIAAQWNTESLSHTSGLWYVVERSGAEGATFGTPVSPLDGKTLEEIYNGGLGLDGNAALAEIFSSNAKISVLEFGLGTSQQNANNFISYLETSIYNSGDRVTFVPEPASLSLLALGGIALLGRRRRIA